MTSLTLPALVQSPSVDESSGDVLNAFEITNARDLAWNVRLYQVTAASGEKIDHRNGGKIKTAIWDFRKQHGKPNWGYGFVIDLGDQTIAVPVTWEIPTDTVYGGYRIRFDKACTATATDYAFVDLVTAMINEGVKKRLKKSNDRNIGPLWQDYRDFCQMPDRGIGRGDYVFVRRFRAVPHLLKNGLWVLNLQVRTGSLDRKSLADYYTAGQVDLLAQYVSAKRANRLTRRNEPTAIRVWTNGSVPGAPGEALEVDDPSTIIAHATLPRHEQRNLSTTQLRCRHFARGVTEVPLRDARLILDTQITGDAHRDTIIAPNERYRLTCLIRDIIQGANLSGCTLNLAKNPIQTNLFPVGIVLPPAIRVRDSKLGEIVIPAPEATTEDAIRQRGYRRAVHLRKHGFLETRPINPVLACPSSFASRRSKRMVGDLNFVLKEMNTDYRFGAPISYDNVPQLARDLEHSDYDALLAVLPEDATSSTSESDTHEQIKRLIELPSQCIRHSNTLPESWVDKPWRQFKEEQPQLAKRVQERYGLSIHNLLVKQHWVPFAPAQNSYFNVQVGLDVGGRHNTDVMACLGYGFSNPAEGLLFLPEQIPIGVQQREPIPTEYLYNGLLDIFSKVYAERQHLSLPTDFERVAFYRDGKFFGHEDDWNELDALKRLHAKLLERNWITRNASWLGLGIEIMKAAEGWRVFSSNRGIANPLVGFWTRPFEDDNTGLICTTGRPYLPQGTAAPLKVRLCPISGHVSWETVAREVLWQADLGFTKPDIGIALPWVLHVADTGALQRSRSYRISGITA